MVPPEGAAAGEFVTATWTLPPSSTAAQVTVSIVLPPVSHPSSERASAALRRAVESTVAAASSPARCVTKTRPLPVVTVTSSAGAPTSCPSSVSVGHILAMSAGATDSAPAFSTAEGVLSIGSGRLDAMAIPAPPTASAAASPAQIAALRRASGSARRSRIFSIGLFFMAWSFRDICLFGFSFGRFPPVRS